MNETTQNMKQNRTIIVLQLLLGAGFFLALALLPGKNLALAQTDIRISGAQAGFPIAVPQLCNAGNAAEAAAAVAKTIRRDLEISGFFKVLDPQTFVETPGKCPVDAAVAYSDWSVIAAEGLVRGEVRQVGDSLEFRFFLHDVQNQRAVLGKKYEVSVSEPAKAAHRMANEIVGYFTGEKGIFGTRIAFVQKVGRFKELFVIDLDGSNIRQVTSDKGLIMSPSWAPAGDKIIYTSFRTRRPELYLTSPDSGGAKRLTEREGLEIGAEFTRDGAAIIAAASIGGISKIVQFNLKGQQVARLTDSSSIDVSPSSSPDGGQIAFCSNRGGGPQIYVMNRDGSAVRRVSFTQSSYCTSPSWSPKGDRLAFVCRTEGGNQLFISAPDGSAVSQLTFAGNNEDPSWAPDGRYLAFSSTRGRGGGAGIVVLTVQTGQMAQITPTGSDSTQPAWSPALE